VAGRRAESDASGEDAHHGPFILCKEGGTWKLLHQHAAIGVPNDQVEAFRGVEEAMAQP
jgi:hypothetical protein